MASYAANSGVDAEGDGGTLTGACVYVGVDTEAAEEAKAGEPQQPGRFDGGPCTGALGASDMQREAAKSNMEMSGIPGAQSLRTETSSSKLKA